MVLDRIKSTATMSIGMSLIGLVLMAVVGVAVGDSVTECMSEINRCGGDAGTALTNAINGFTLDSYGASMLESFCREKDSLIDCFESSGGVCPESLVEEWKKSLQLAAYSCVALECAKKMFGCGEDVANKFRLGMSKSPETYLMMGTGAIQDMCRSSANLKTCIKGSEAECSSPVTNVWIAQLDGMKPVCDMLPCNNALNACFDPYNYIMINPTFDVGTLHKICSVIDDTDKCLQRITACPKEVVDLMSSTMSTYHQLCKMTADCTKSVLNCVGDAAIPFFGAVASGKLDVDTLEKVCPVQDRVSVCLDQSTTCPLSFKGQYKATVANFATLGCNYMPCAKKYEKCVGEVGKVLMSGNDYGAGALEQVCKNKDTILKCLSELTPECPNDFVQIQNGYLQGYLGMGCNFIPCIKKVQACHVSMFKGVDIQQLNPASLIVFCNNMVIAQTCLAALNPECPAEVTNPYQASMKIWADSCSPVACTNELVACFGKHGNNLMNPTFDAITLTNACSDIDNINTCIQDITTCPAEFLKPYVNAGNGYQTTCKQIAACTKSLQDCAGENANVFLDAVSNGAYGVATLEKLCGAETLLTSCIDKVTTCPREVIATYVSTMSTVKMGCAFTACLQKMEGCGNEYVRIFMSGTDYATGGLEQICKQNASISSCLDKMNDVCPSSIVQAKELELAMTLQTCRYVPCAKKVQACGMNMLKGYNGFSLDPDTLISSCKNILRVETCMNLIGSDICSKTVSDQWNGPLKEWARRCADILKKAREKSRPITGGKKVAIVLKLDMKWNDKLENLESEENKPFVTELKNSLTEVYKDTKGFKEVTIVRLFKSSVGVEHTVEYKQELTTKDLAMVASTLNTALAKNGNSLAVGDKTFAAVGKPEMLFPGEVAMTDLCDMYTKDTECKNGGACYASNTEARCVCKYGYRGDYCDTESGQSTILPAMFAIVASIIGSVLLAELYV